MFSWAERNKNRAILRKHSSDADETVIENATEECSA